MKLGKALLMIGLIVFLSQSAVFAVEIIEVPYADDLVFVDGVLDESSWSEATTLRFCADPAVNGCDNDPLGVKGQPSGDDYYEVSFLHDGFMLYVGVEAFVSHVAAADPSTVFSTGIPEMLFKVYGESRGLPYRLTWVDTEMGAGPRVTESSMWYWAPDTGEWAYTLKEGTVPNSGEAGSGYVLEMSVSLFELGYLGIGDPIPFSMVLFNFAGPVGGKWDEPDARYSRYELGQFLTLAETVDPAFTHALQLNW